MNEVMTIAGRKLIFPLQGERRAIIERAVIAIETETRALTETDLRMAWIDDAAARDREITALRAALDGLIAAARETVRSAILVEIGPDTEVWSVHSASLASLRLALAAAKETP